MTMRSESPGSPATPQIVRVTEWERYLWLRAGFSTRFAGLSTAYGADELNLGWTADDSPEIVARNRTAFARAVADEARMTLVTVGQVHGTVVHDFDRQSGPLRTAEGKATLEGDGLVTLKPGKLLAVLTADCVPVLVADTRTHAVGAFHAGWRGTLGGIAAQGITLMREHYGAQPNDLIAAIGPCIGACCFEVGDEVRAAFVAKSAQSDELFIPASPGKWRFDLVEANRRQIAAAGVALSRVQSVGECTACTFREDGRRHYYSYRAEQGRCGRMLSAIGAVA